ncbi:dienelactone hydrolase family protein [Geomonas anaerohicana]|uniref:Dienelactone hydrolase family protein n=1 Tax=Geomonas anaerohicana TaxID=2798583 RepID=A0ABS0YCT2_9BACT|nr:dienelactone hydrolase family protein [Geomonas anaerohicana]MBJ6750101.1 dienelactone hydrolase family protein [Geomonas anaerohicana]
MKKYLLALMMTLVAQGAGAAVVGHNVEYRQGDTVLEGYLAYDDTIKEKRPGVLIIHEWTGVSPYEKMRAEQLARLGYVAFAADIYGKGVRPVGPEQAAKEAAKYRGNDRSLIRARGAAGLETLAGLPQVDPKRLAVMGYCFGGTAALELARSGADVLGTVSFHGGLSTPNPADAKNIRGKVLALHGADDPYVKPDEVAAFQKEMRDAKVDWQMNYYGNAVHSFTNPKSGNDNSKGAAYNEKADRRSFEAMKLFFNEIFGTR